METDNRKEIDQPEDSLYYSLEDEDEQTLTENNVDEEEDIDKSGPNYSQAEVTDEGPESGNEGETGEASPMDSGQKTSCFLLLLEVLLNPLEGWKRIRRQKVAAERMQQSCFYPLLALLAISNFSDLFYSPRTSISEMVVNGVSSFVAFFFGYFFIIIVMKSLLKKNFENPSSENWVKVYVMFNLSSLALFFALIEFFPMLWAVLIFLPLWTVYIVCRGAKFLKIPDSKQITITACISLLIVGVPSLFDILLNEVLPK